MSEIDAPAAAEGPFEQQAATPAGGEGGGSFVTSPVGRKVVPAVSIGLIVAGVILVLVGLTGSDDPGQQVVTESAAPAQLLVAMETAKAVMVEENPNSYVRFTPEDAPRPPKGTEWVMGGPAVAGKIVIHTPGKTGIVLVAKDVSTGQIYCIADSNADDAVTKGDVDAVIPDECTGGWPAT